MPVRLLYLVDQPIQYQAPLLRTIAAAGDFDLRVIFRHRGAASARYDAGFGREVAWDVPLLDGYAFEVEPSARQLAPSIARSDVLWLHGWNGPRVWRALAEARRLGVPVLMRGENTLAAMPDGAGPRGILKRRYLGWVFSRCAAFLYIGTANRDYYLAHGVEAARLFAMPYAVDNDFFRSRAEAAAPGRAELCRALGLAEGRPVILFAGKLQPRKNPLALAAAFRALDRGALNRPYLVFVGDGELRGRLEQIAAGDDAIRVLGFRNQTELPALYDLAHVFVLAAYREPWGLAVNEAMNGGCAIVVSDQCGCAADLVDERCGAVVPAGEAGPLADALTRILSDPGRCRAMGEAARARIGAWNFQADLEGLRRAVAFVSTRFPAE